MGGGAIFVDGAERATFVCERGAGVCTHTLERLGQAAVRQEMPVGELLGATYKWSYWDVAPDASARLAGAGSMDDVDPTWLWVDRNPRPSHTYQSPAIVTRRGVLGLLPGFPPGSVGSLDTVTEFAAGRGPDRVELVQDDWYSGAPVAVVLAGIGAFLVLMTSPAPPRR